MTALRPRPGHPLRGGVGHRPQPAGQPGLRVRQRPAAGGGRRDGRRRGPGQRGRHRRAEAAGGRRCPPATCSTRWPTRCSRPARRCRTSPRPSPAQAGSGTTLTAMLWSGSQLGPGAHRRHPGLPAARRRAVPDHPRPHRRPVADRRGAAHRRGSRLAPGALPAAARPGRDPGGRARPVAARGPARRPLPALLGRADHRRPGGPASTRCCAPRPSPRAGGAAS